MDKVTYDDVYQIAAEVCEDMITKFLRNLVKLVPEAEEEVEDLQESQYRELQELRAQTGRDKRAMKEALVYPDKKQSKSVDYAPDEIVEENVDDEFAKIAHPETAGDGADWNPMMGTEDDVLSQIPLQTGNLVEAQLNAAQGN